MITWTRVTQLALSLPQVVWGQGTMVMLKSVTESVLPVGFLAYRSLLQLKVTDIQAVRPVLVCQLVGARQEYSDAPFTIGGREVKRVSRREHLRSCSTFLTHVPSSQFPIGTNCRVCRFREEFSYKDRLRARRWEHTWRKDNGLSMVS
jgi:hypothetical protein